MKKFISLFVILFTIVLMGLSQTPTDLYEKYKGNEDVTTIVLNHNLFGMVGDMEIEIEDEMSTVLQKLDKMIILTSEKINFQDELDLTLYKELIEVNDGEESKIYAKLDGEDIKELIILTKDEDGYNLVFIKGLIELEKLGNCVKK